MDAQPGTKAAVCSAPEAKVTNPGADPPAWVSDEILPRDRDISHLGSNHQPQPPSLVLDVDSRDYGLPDKERFLARLCSGISCGPLSQGGARVCLRT